MTSSHSPEVLTIEEAARLLRISRQSAYNAVRSGELASVRIGRRLLVPRRALEQLREMERRLDPELDAVRRQMRDEVLRHLLGSNGDAPDEKTLAAAELKAKADAIAAEHATVRVAEFPC